MRNKNPLDGLRASDVQEVELSGPVHWVSTERKEDIDLIVHTLKSIKLKRIISTNKDGFAAALTIRLSSGKEINIVIRPEEIVLDDAYYKPDKDYSSTFQEILKQIEEGQVTDE